MPRRWVKERVDRNLHGAVFEAVEALRRITMRVLSILLAMALAGALMAQPVMPPRTQPRIEKPKAVDMSLPVSPLAVNGSTAPEINLGRVFKLNSRFFPVVIENPSDEPVKYTAIVINCTCTKVVQCEVVSSDGGARRYPARKIPKSGVIPPKGRLRLVMCMNANDLKVKEKFLRMLRLELEKYRSFQVNFTGELSRDLFMYFGDDPQRAPRTEITIGYLDNPNTKWNTMIYIESKLPKDQPLELGQVRTSRNFSAALHRYSDHKWGIELHSANPMRIGELKDFVRVEVKTPSPQFKHQMDMLVFPIVGVCGTKLEASTFDMFNDPKEDPETVTKAFLLRRMPFMDRIAYTAAVMGQPNPYISKVKVLKVEEVEVPKVKGVELRLEQRETGVLVHCTMHRSQMTEDGEEVFFKAKETQSEKVRFAILGEEERRMMAEEAARKAKEAKERAEAEAEQQRLLKEGGHAAEEK